MTSNRLRIGRWVLLLIVLSTALGRELPLAHAAFPADPDVVAAFDDVTKYVASIPTRLLTTPQRNNLVAKLTAGRKRYIDGDVCGAHTVMNGFVKEAQTYRTANQMAIAEELYNRGRTLRDSLFDLFIADASLTRPGCFNDSLRRAPKVALKTSNNVRVIGALTLGAPRVATVIAGDETWTELTLPGVQDQIGEPGMPALPSWQTLLAVPHGATPVLVQRAVAIRETLRLNLYPFQPQPSDESSRQSSPSPRDIFMDKPFVKHAPSYATNTLLPQAPCAIRSMGSMRDLEVIQVQCIGGQYNPVTDELRLFGSVEFEVQFHGGDGTFITSQSLNPFETGSATAIHAVLNSAAASDYVQVVDVGARQCHGEELLILTHPDFRSAANELATWKRTKGIATTVFDVGNGTPYNTGRRIDRLIQQRYDTCQTRPSYVLLVGDSQFVPPARIDYRTTQEPDDTTGSDWGYATSLVTSGQVQIEGTLPYFAVGRLPVNHPFYAEQVVRKTIQYESAPPFINFFAGAPFYTTAMVASYFQCCREDASYLGAGWSLTGREMRAFIENAEAVRNRLTTNGYAVQRIYNTSTELAGDSVVVVDASPRRYHGGDPLPPDLAPASGFVWEAWPNDIIDAFNDGRFLIVHRGHGEEQRWWQPPLGTGHLDLITNNHPSLPHRNLLPIVYSINCKSGYWDSETDGVGGQSLMEGLLNGHSGMVGGIGDNRNSPSEGNNALLRGLIDATWIEHAPEFGSGGRVRRLGDILNHGKRYLATQIGVSQAAGSVTEDHLRDQLIIYHVFGDPTLEMWTSNPYLLELSGTVEITVQQDGFTATYPLEGTEITALQVLTNGSTRPLARGTVQGGTVLLRFVVPGLKQVDLSRVRFAASLPNAVSVPLTAVSAGRSPAR